MAPAQFVKNALIIVRNVNAISSSVGTFCRYCCEYHGVRIERVTVGDADLSSVRETLSAILAITKKDAVECITIDADHAEINSRDRFFWLQKDAKLPVHPGVLQRHRQKRKDNPSLSRCCMHRRHHHSSHENHYASEDNDGNGTIPLTVTLSDRLSPSSPSHVTSRRGRGRAEEDKLPQAQSQSQSPQSLPHSTARTDALSWDDYFMSVCALSALRSKDPHTQVGACLVDAKQRILGIGYNGFPRGCSDHELPWIRDAPTALDNKYPWVVHAEVNAIMNKNAASVEGSTLYVTLFPCNECAKVLIQAGVRSVVYLQDKHPEADCYIASRRMFAMARINCRQHTPKSSSIVLTFPEVDEMPPAGVSLMDRGRGRGGGKERGISRQ